MAEDNNQSTEKPFFRDWLALGISGISILGIIVLSVAIFRNLATDSDKVMTIFTTFVALIGSWVGTILAFYFSKENFESATRNVTALVNQMSPQEKLKTISIKEKMTPKDKMFFKKLPAEQILLVETLKGLELSQKGSRIPVLDEKEQPAYIIHRSTIIEFLYDKKKETSSPPIGEEKLSLKDLLADKEFEKLALNFVVVKEDVTLADAKTAMDAKAGCQDIFITKGGKMDEPLIGWITNKTIVECAVV